MSEDQRQALVERVESILGEHGIGYVFAVEMEEDNGATSPLFCYGGGHSLAEGLAGKLRKWVKEQERQAEYED